MSFNGVPEDLEKQIFKQAEEDGCVLVDVMARQRAGLSFEIVLDRTGGITLDECMTFNRKISRWIDENMGLDGQFSVDVCSPGLDRELKTEIELDWAKGRDVKVTLHDPLDGKSSLEGRLSEPGERIVVICGEEEVSLDRENISRIKLLAPKGKIGKKKA